MDSAKPKHGDVIVAVDFGTTRTAVAYTFAGEENQVINVLQPQRAGSFLPGDPKTPTSLLMEGDRAIAFGYLAERKFADDGDENPEWRLFKSFKMELHNAEEPDPPVQSLGNRGCLPLSSLLTESLKFVKENTVRHLKGTGVLMSGNPHDVFWILTVPAIWDDFAKSMMRRAAHQAGLISHENSDKLLLALEPECAAIFSQTWDAGRRFMIADCGGGTVDITIHEMLQSSPLKLREVDVPAGGSFGAKKVDEKFFEFISSFLGRENYDKLEGTHSSEHFNLISQWEEKKMCLLFEDDEDEWTRIDLISVCHALELSNEDLSVMVEQWNLSHPQTTLKPLRKNTKSISLPLQLIKSFFTEAVEGIVAEVYKAAALNGLKHIVLAGGFSKCPLIHQKVVEAVKSLGIEVIHATEPDLCIVKGAARFGTYPKELIESRIAPYTIGIAACQNFNPFVFKHWWKIWEMSTDADKRKRFSIFDVHVHAGNSIPSQNLQKHFYKPITEEQRFIAIEVLVTEKDNVFLENEAGVACLCRAEVDLGDIMKLPLKDRGVWVQFSLGGAEMRCHVFDKDRKRELNNIKVDFKFHKKRSLSREAKVKV